MPAAGLIHFPPFHLDLANAQLWRGTQLIPLRPKPFALLRYLVDNPGRLVTKEELLQAVWPETYVSEGLLSTYIRDLRTVLGDDPAAPRFIETVVRRGYRFIAPLTPAPPAASLPLPVPRSDAQHSALRTQHSVLVGREPELAQLHEWLAKALSGEHQVVFVTGEPGIGKTTLVDAFLQHVAASGGLWLGRGQCIEHYGAGEAYLPLLKAVGRLCREAGGERLIALLHRHAPTWLLQMPALLSDTELEALQRKGQGVTRDRMLREFAELVEAVSAERPLVLALEDLHWSDPSTLEVLTLLAQRREAARLLVLGTYRPTEVIVSGHPLRAIKQELHAHRQCEEVALGCLSEAAVAEYLARRFPGSALPPQLARVIHRSTEGNPLFMVAVVDDLIAQGSLRESAGYWQLQAAPEAVTVGIPESLRQLIERQIERLPREEQRVLEVASVAGAEFSALAVAAEGGEGIEQIEAWCEGVVRRGPFLRAGGTETLPDGTLTGRYGFVHSLYQSVVYERLGAIRRTRLHRRIGERLEHAYGTHAGEIATELAVHFERGRDYARAVQYRQQAGNSALRRHALPEAIAHFSTGLELLTTLPATPARRQQELALQLALGPPLSATKGWAAPDTGRAYARARELCQQAEDTAELFPALFGLWVFHYTRAELATARELAEQLLHHAQRDKEPALLMEAYHALGNTLHRLGELTAARAHLEQSLALYDAQQHHVPAMQYGMDDGVAGLGYSTWVLWSLGYADQAVHKSQAVLSLAQELAHPLSRAWAYNAVAWLYQFRREAQNAHAWTDAGLAVCAEQGFTQLLAVGTIVQGWALTAQGQAEAGIGRMREGLTALRDTGTAIGYPRYLGMLAEAYGAAQQAEVGLSLLGEALAVVEQTGERFYEAELYRLRGTLTLKQSGVWSPESEVISPQPPTPSTHAEAEAEACFLKALEIARRQQAKSLELRAAMSLSRLWRQQGKKKEAHELLAAIYGWFTEGFDTKDLQEAKALLDELATDRKEGKKGGAR